MSLVLRPARGEDDLAAVRALCWDYRAHLIDHHPPTRAVIEAVYPEAGYAAVLADLAALHARPKGEILLARLGDAPVGCGMSYEQAPGAVELKRVYVAPAGRGQGIARRLCDALIAQAAADGYTTVRLDTLHTLIAAQALYARLGFHRRDAYYDVPALAAPHIRFYERSIA